MKLFHIRILVVPWSGTEPGCATEPSRAQRSRPVERRSRPVAGSAKRRPKEGSGACLPPGVDLEATEPAKRAAPGGALVGRLYRRFFTPRNPEAKRRDGRFDRAAEREVQFRDGKNDRNLKQNVADSRRSGAKRPTTYVTRFSARWRSVCQPELVDLHL